MKVKNFLILLLFAALAVFSPVAAFADGILNCSALVTAGVTESVEVSSALGAISLTGIDPFDGVNTSNSSNFTVKAISTDTVYDVWLIVPAAYLDAENAVSVNPATINVQPTSGSKSDGDGVSETDATGTFYLVSLTENIAVAHLPQLSGRRVHGHGHGQYRPWRLTI